MTERKRSCVCIGAGLEPFWEERPTGDVFCLRCGYIAPVPADPPPAADAKLEHPLAAAAILAAALTPDLPEPP